MAGMEVSTLAVKVTSDGIKQATTDLDALVVAAGKAENAAVLVKDGTTNLANAQKSGSSAATTYIAGLQKKADLLGATNSQTAIYTATMKGLEDADVRLAGSLGAQVDSWKALGVAQKEAIAINNEMNKAAKDTAESLDSQTTRLRAVAEAGATHQASLRAEADAYRAGATAIKTSDEAKLSSVRTTESVTKAQTAQMQGANTLAARVENLSKAQLANNAANQSATTQFNKLAGQVDPYIAKMAKLDAQQQELTAAFKKGGGSLDDYNAAMGRISSARKDLGTQQMHDLAKGSNTAGEAMQAFSLKTSAARRELTVMGREIARGDWGALARSTSIFVERSGLMQGALIALQNPITWVIAGMTAIGVAAYMGSTELTDFNKALTLTGSYAGLTALQFDAMSKSIGDITGGQHAAAAALTEVATTGKFTADQIGLVGRAAVEMNAMTGAAVGQTISQFEKLTEKPLEGLLKLDEQYHFLTLSVYEHVKSLQEQGREQDAVTAAIKAFSDNSHDAMTKVVQDAGYAETIWKNLKATIDSAANAFMGFGRQSEKVASLTQQLAKEQAELNSQSKGDIGYDARVTRMADLKLQLAQIQSMDDVQKMQLKQVKNGQDAESAAARATAENDKFNASLKGTSRAQEEINKAKIRFAAIYSVNPMDAQLKGVSFDVNGQPTGGGMFQAQVDKINKDNAPKDAKGRGNEFTQQAALMEQKGLYEQSQRDLKDNVDSLKHLKSMELIDSQTFLTKEFELNQNALQDQLEIAQKQMKIAETQHNPTNAQKYANDVQRIQDSMNANLKKYGDDKELLLDKDRKAVEIYQEQLETALATRQNAINDAILGVGMGSQQKTEMATMLTARREFDAQMLKLDKEREKLGPDVYNEEVKKQQEAYATRVAMEKQGFADMKAAQDNWKNGAFSAFDDYQTAAANVAGQTATVFTNAFKGMEDSIVSFATTGKLNFKSFATSIITDMTRMAAKAASNQLIGGLLQLGLSMFGGSGMASGIGAAGGTGGAVAAGATPGSTFGGLGGGFYGSTGPAPVFADGGAFTNGVVSRPTSFNMATMGEAGSEAIMPLSKTSDGSLGVKMAGGSGGSAPQINIQTSIAISDGKSTTKTSSDSSDANAKLLAASLEQTIKGQIVKEMQQGGVIWKVTNKQLGT